MLYRLLMCLVLLAIMALLIKALETCWEISNSSSPSNLLWGLYTTTPPHTHTPPSPPYSTGLWKSPSNLACSNRWACEGKKYHFINPLKIKTRWKEHNPAVEKRTRVGFGEKNVRTVCTATLKCMVNINQQANTWRGTRAHLNWHDSSSWLDETLRWIYNRQPVMLPDANGTF